MARNIRKSVLHRRSLASGKADLCVQENGGKLVPRREAQAPRVAKDHDEKWRQPMEDTIFRPDRNASSRDYEHVP